MYIISNSIPMNGTEHIVDRNQKKHSHKHAKERSAKNVIVEKINPVLLTDVYNLCHQDFKINTDWEVSHIYNRNSPMILYGLNKTIEYVFDKMQITYDNIREAERYASEMNVWFPSELFYTIVDDLNGYMPVNIQAIPDGNWVPRGTPFCQIRNTVKGFGECVTWWEAMLLHAWFPSACATQAFYMRKYLNSKELPANRFHSFGFRSHRSLEDAYWAGTAWNLFLPGTDDFHTKKYTTTASISSIPALAHKVVEQFDNELECYIRAIDQTAIHGKKYVSIVIDTFNTDNFIDKYADYIAKYAAAKGVKPVFRPDSGNTLEQTISIWRKCHKWNPLFIIGDEMNFEKAKEYDRFLETNDIPLQNMTYGIGGGFYNYLTRETLGWAMKTAYSNGRNRMKFSENKWSIPGKVKLVKDYVGKISVFSEDANIEGYLNICNHDKDPLSHYCITDTWNAIQKRAIGYLDAKELQNEIIISDQVKDEIENIRESFKCNM
jgi:nicotinamide phosphoribosyltransferase